MLSYLSLTWQHICRQLDMKEEQKHQDTIMREKGHQTNLYVQLLRDTF